MKRSTRVGAVGVAAVVMATVLSGCMGGADFAVLEKEPQAADALPDAAVDDNDGVVAPDTVRFVGKDGDVSLWLARPASGSGICVVAYQSDDAYATGCADNGTWVRLSGELGTYEVAPDGSPTPEGTERLFDNVFVPAG